MTVCELEAMAHRKFPSFPILELCKYLRQLRPGEDWPNGMWFRNSAAPVGEETLQGGGPQSCKLVYNPINCTYITYKHYKPKFLEL